MNRINIKKIEYILMGFCILIIALVIFPHSFYNMSYRSYDHDIAIDYCDNWKIQNIDNTAKVITLPYSMRNINANQVIISKKLPESTKGLNCIAIPAKRQDVTVYIDSTVRASYTDKYTRKFGKSSANMTLFVPLFIDDSGKEIQIKYSNFAISGPGSIAKISIGTEKGLVLHMVKSNILSVIIAVVLLLISLFCLVLYILVRPNIQYDVDILYLFWFSLVFGVWILAQSDMRQLYLKNLSLASDVGYMCMLFYSIPILFYLNSVLHEKYNIIYLGLIFINLINAFVQILLQHLDLVEYSIMIKYTHLLIFIELIVIFVSFCIEIFFKHAKELWVFFIGHLILSFCGISEIISAITLNTEANGRIFCIGMLSFVAINVTNTAIRIIKEGQSRRNAIAESKAKSKFLATMSHEIRTPINSVLGMNEMILRESTEKNILEYSSTISNASHSLLSLVNDILDFSKIEEGKLDIIDVNYVLGYTLRDLINMLRVRADEKGLKLIIDIDHNLPTEYYGDEVRIKQILTNLLTNAIKYTDKGSISLVVKENHRIGNEIWIYFEVTDTGKGIKPEDIESIGSSFSRYDLINNRSIEGTGLGLSITKQLLDLMDSNLSVKSVYSKGSTFSFIIKQKIVDSKPMEDLYTEGINIKQAHEVSLYAPKAKLLVVDDNQLNLFVIEKLLEQTGMQLFKAESGKEAISLIYNNSFDIVLMDHMMPEMDGIDTLKRIRELKIENAINTKFVALTANAVSGARNMYLDNGFVEYLTKPVEFRELQECIINLLPKELLESRDNSSEIGNEANKHEMLLCTDRINGIQAFEFCGNDLDTYKAVLESYYTDGMKYLEDRKKSHESFFDTDDLNGITLTAHTYKSLSKTIGAYSLSDLFFKIEKAAKSEDLDYIESIDTKIANEFEEILKEIGKYLSDD